MLLRDGLRIGYDHLIVAAGATHSYFVNDAWAAHAPGLKTLDEVRLVTQAVGRPVNVNMSGVPQATVAQIAAAGGKRISTGGALARAAIGALVRAGREMQEQGSFGWASSATPGAEVARLLR